MTGKESEMILGALQQRFDAEVDIEPVNGDGRYRLAVVSPQFRTMTQLQRQDAIWSLVDQTLSRQATLDISLILAFAPGELAEAEGAA